MSKRSFTHPSSSPPSFSQHNRTKFQRTVVLTQKAIKHLEAEGRTITLAAVCEATGHFDEGGKTLAPITILRNPEAAALFRQSSPACQARVQRAKKAKRKHQMSLDVRAVYHGLRARDLIQMIEELKGQITAMEAKQTQLKRERDEAIRLRDEALEQNVRQLATLTQLVSQSPTAALQKSA